MKVEDEEWVQHALLDFERKRTISKVLSIDCKDAVPKGNNYASDMYRLNVKAVLYSGDLVNKSFIYKVLPATEAQRKVVTGSKLPATENTMYREVLPGMERLRQEKHRDIEPLAPTCYGIRGNGDAFIFEDLNEKGYKMADRIKGLDFGHATLAVKSLAEYHALSLVLIERGDLIPNYFKGNLLLDDPKIIDTVIPTTLEELVKTIEENWQGEWLEYAERLREFSKTVREKLTDAFTLNDKNLNVLLHGDCWTTNIMFRYNAQGLPVNSRLIDFQLPHYNSVSIDLQYLFNTSLTADTLKRKHELLRLYYDGFKYHLSLYGLSDKTPTFDELVENQDRANIFGLVTGLTLRPLMMRPSESVPQDLEEFQDGKNAAPPKIDIENFGSALKVILEGGRNEGLL